MTVDYVHWLGCHTHQYARQVRPSRTREDLFQVDTTYRETYIENLIKLVLKFFLSGIKSGASLKLCLGFSGASVTAASREEKKIHAKLILTLSIGQENWSFFFFIFIFSSWFSWKVTCFALNISYSERERTHLIALLLLLLFRTAKKSTKKLLEKNKKKKKK